MKQYAGVSVLLAVAVAALRLSGGYQSAEVSSGATSEVHRTTPKQVIVVAPQKASYQGGCTVFDGEDAKAGADASRGEARSVIRSFFQLKDLEELKTKPDVRFAIALSPDPRHTNLGLMFDREMVGIQQAAQDEGYNFSSSWLPWSSGPSGHPAAESPQGAEKASHRESCPGVLLFRRSVRDLGPDTDAAHLHDPYGEALVVLVVGEQPTAGLNAVQWENAISWLNRNAFVPQPGSRSLRILGPTFSGSLVSLQRELANLKVSPGVLEDGKAVEAFFPSASTGVRILSGSVSRCATTQWFRRTTQLTRPGGTTTFGSFQESDELEIFRFLNYEEEQGTRAKDVAIVSEDETAYANSSTPANGDKSATTAPCEFSYARANAPLRLSYPRDISALRSAYEKEELFSSGGGRGSHAVLQENAELQGEAANVTDTIRSYGGSFTPVAEEAVLYGLVSNLRAHHSRYIMLRCTNPLDFLFLTRFFHRAYPEGRIVTVGSDLLFRREIDTTEFRGVLALSNYPLLPREQHWAHLSARANDAPPLAHTHRIPDSHMEGTYLAARYLFDNDAPEGAVKGGQGLLLLPFKENLPDFADPFWMHKSDEAFENTQAPVWLTVVGRDGYWPVAVLNAISTPNNCLDRTAKNIVKGVEQRCPPRVDAREAPPSAMVKIAGAAGGRSAHYDQDPENSARFDPSLRFTYPLSWEVCAIIATFILMYQTFGVWLGYRFTSSGLFALFRRVATPSQAVLVGINSAFALSLLLQLLMTGMMLPNLTNVFREPGEFTLFATVWLVLFCAVLYRFLREGKRTDRIALSSMAAALFFLVACAIWVWFSDRPIWKANNLPLFMRMTHLAQGISPLVPLLFLLLGFYLWTWQAMAGNSLLCCGVPILPELEDASFPSTSNPWWRYWTSIGYFKLLGLPTAPRVTSGAVYLGKSFHRVSHEIGKRIIKIASPVCLDPEVVLLPVALFVAAFAYLLNVGTPLLGMEGRAYAWIINIALLFAFLLTIAEAGRLFFTWKELQRLLTALSRLRLRRTFAKLRAIDGNSLWSVSGNVQRVQYHFFAQQLDAANRLCRLNESGFLSVMTAVEFGKLFSANSADKIDAGPLWEKPIVSNTGRQIYIREIFNDAVTEVLNQLISQWATETDSLSLETAPAGKSDDERERNVFDMELCKDETVRAAEEFVCFHYIAFIQNILARMRTMTLSMIYLFVAICLAISFYPFVPRNSIGIWMMINLLFIGATVAYVYAGMERDETLSYITNTKAGRLSAAFYLKTASFLAGPVIGLLTTQFPAISESVLGWLQPGLDALK